MYVHVHHITFSSLVLCLMSYVHAVVFLEVHSQLATHAKVYALEDRNTDTPSVFKSRVTLAGWNTKTACFW